MDAGAHAAVWLEAHHHHHHQHRHRHDRHRPQIIRGVLDLHGKDAAAAMTPLDRVFALHADAVLDRYGMKRAGGWAGGRGSAWQVWESSAWQSAVL